MATTSVAPVILQGHRALDRFGLSFFYPLSASMYSASSAQSQKYEEVMYRCRGHVVLKI